jgi:GNAT superfamily N-acetyltransferase
MKKTRLCQWIRFAITEDGQEIGRAHLYILYNDLHMQPFGLMEDVFIEANHQRRGMGTVLVRQVIATARTEGCYKLIATSRFKRGHVHTLYKKLGFEEYGTEFRMNF